MTDLAARSTDRPEPRIPRRRAPRCARRVDRRARSEDHRSRGLPGARYDAGLAWVHFPKGFGGLGLRPELNRMVEQRLRAAGATPQRSDIVLHGAGRTDDRHPRHRRAEAALPSADVHRRGDLVPAVLRAGRRLRLRRSRLPRRSRRRRVDRQRPEGLEHARPPRRPGHARDPYRSRRAEAQGHDLLRARHARARASRCGRCVRSPARPSSTRCTSPMCGSPMPTGSARWARAGEWR